MAPIIPASLEGSNLGECHRYLNSLVTKAYNNDSVEAILNAPEYSAVDRLIKIDFASKHKHVEYIVQNLQVDDMLYVSRALKSTWLLREEYCYIIYPGYIEAALYPNMLTTAVNKMKHWIYLNLNDSERCLEFYKYYSMRDSSYAFKFLSKCPVEIILSELPKTKTLENITPHRLKVLCEKTPAVAKLFYKMLLEDIVPVPLVNTFIGKEQEYFNNIICILKTDIVTFLDITENFFQSHFKRLSMNSTKFIMSHGKNRFLQKPELYTTRILNVNAVAQCLTPAECEDLVIKLACAQYLKDWFNYKNVEPLLKRLDFTKRESLKKKVFVDKDIEESVITWPYDLPQKIAFDNIVNEVFLEFKETYKFDDFRQRKRLRGGKSDHFPSTASKKTPLEALFEQYRFSNFDKTLFELRKKLKRESSSQYRMYMLLVLVSKSGGRSESLDTLFQLLLDFKNEPCQVRAAVIRSLVKRVSVWRVTEDNWRSLLIFGRGLGLDGDVPEADCNEGLHAVIIRSLLSGHDCKTATKVAFLKNFSTFSDYSLTKDEKELIKQPLLKMLVEWANAQVVAKTGVQILEYAIDTIQAYKIKFDTQPELTFTIRKLQRNDPAAVLCLLQRLFRSKLGRKELYKENFDFVQTDASYVNALKHDITILSVDKYIKAVVFDDLYAEQFLRKISIYFNGNRKYGNEDLACRFFIAVKESKIHKNLARPITYLIGNDLKSYMLDLDNKDAEYKRFSARVRANSHVARPGLNLDSLEWQKAGAKFIANRVIICKGVDLDALIKKLLTWNKTARLAIILAQRTCYEADVFKAVARMRPVIALKTALAYFRLQGRESDLQIWKIVKPLIVKVKENPYLVSNIKNADSIPSSIRAEYLTEAFKVVHEIDFDKSMSLLWRIKEVFLKVDENFIADVLKDFANNHFVSDVFRSLQDMVVTLYFSILGKYLLLCKTKDTQTKRFESVGQLYLDRLQSIWESKETNSKTWFFYYLELLSKSPRQPEMFLNNEYVSCLPVMEKIIKWMRGILPVEKHFVAYVPFYLNILYYKAIRKATEEMPGILVDEERRDEAYKIVGETFGRYVGEEACALKKEYFDSIVILYGLGLGKFFAGFNKNRDRIASYITKGIIDASNGIECILGLDILENNLYGMYEEENEYIHDCLSRKNSIEMQFFYNWKQKTDL